VTRPCIICEDDFDRSNDTDISPFVEKSGDWSIDGNRLEEAGGANGIAYCPTIHPVVTWTAVAHVWLVNMASGNEYVLFVNYDPVAGDFEGAKFVCDDATYGTLSLVGSGGGSDSLSNIPYGPPDFDNEILISICRNENAIWVENSNTIGLVYDLLDRSGDTEKQRYAGVQNPGANAVFFDDFRYEEHHSTNPICDCCWCLCGNRWGGGFCPNFGAPHVSLPRTLLATFVVYGSDCPQWFIDAVDGLECTLTIYSCDQDYVIWSGSVTGPNEDNSGTETYYVYIYCWATETIYGQFEMLVCSATMFGTCDAPPNGAGSGSPPDLDQTTCEADAISIRFTNFGAPTDDCYTDVIVTEPP
jgi:hypothetical protein